MRIIISKLSYKLCERWRAHAYECEEHNRRRAKFIQSVEFVNRQAKVISNPLLEIWMLWQKMKNTPTSLQGTKLKREGKRSGSFATVVKQAGETQKDLTMMKNNRAPVTSAFTEPCAFCEKGQTLERCYQFGDKTYKDKLDFLRKNGFIFGYLVEGHLSKD